MSSILFITCRASSSITMGVERLLSGFGEWAEAEALAYVLWTRASAQEVRERLSYALGCGVGLSVVDITHCPDSYDSIPPLLKQRRPKPVSVPIRDATAEPDLAQH